MDDVTRLGNGLHRGGIGEIGGESVYRAGTHLEWPAFWHDGLVLLKNLGIRNLLCMAHRPDQSPFWSCLCIYLKSGSSSSSGDLCMELIL
ncbi:MAG: hypothetical protein AB7E44_11895, partial [Acidithiobacillus sp.]